MVTSLSLLCSLVAVSVAAITSVSDASKEVLQIGALLPSNSSSNDSLWSSFRSVDACYLAVDHVNDYSGLLPNHELRLIFRETMCEFGKANYGMYQFVHSSEAERPVVLLGEGCGVVTEPLAETMEMWNKSNVVLFNFLSSSSSGLDLEEKSNAYMSLLPAASELNSARVELMHKLEWKNAVILYETSTGTIFDRNSKDLVKKIKKVNNNATGLADRYLVTMGNITHIFDKIKASKKRILFSFCYENVARRVVCEAFKKGVKAPEYVWVFFGWYRAKWYEDVTDEMVSCSVDDMKKAVDGHFTLDFIKFRQDRDTMTEIGKTVQEVYMAFQEKGMSLENRSFDQYQAYGYDAVLFIALILDKLNKSTSSNHSPFSLEELPNEVAGEGVTGKLVLSNRTIMTQRNVEIRYVQTKDGEVSTVVYYYNGTENLTEIFQPNWTTEDGKRPLDVPRNETKYFHKGYYIFPATVAVIGVFGAVGMLVFNEYNRDKRIIKLSSPRLNNLIAVGAITIYVAVIFGGLDGQFFPITTNTLFCCYMYVSLLVFGFTLCFGSMFAKTWRVNVVMKRSRMGRTNFKLTDQVLFAIVGVFILVDALLLGLWFGINPFHVTKSIAESEGISNEQHIYVRCSSEHSSRWAYIILAYKAIVLAFGVLMAWETRKVQIVSLNDSRYITMSVYNTVVLCILAFAFHFIPTQHVQYLLVSMIIIIIVTVVLCLVFVPKIYKLVTKGDSDVRHGGHIINTERKSSSEHTIAKKSEIKDLEYQNFKQKQIIRRLLEEKNLSDETIASVQQQLSLNSHVTAASNDVELELMKPNSGTVSLPGTSTEINETSGR